MEEHDCMCDVDTAKFAYDRDTTVERQKHRNAIPAKQAHSESPNIKKTSNYINQNNH